MTQFELNIRLISTAKANSSNVSDHHTATAKSDDTVTATRLSPPTQKAHRGRFLLIYGDAPSNHSKLLCTAASNQRSPPKPFTLSCMPRLPQARNLSFAGRGECSSAVAFTGFGPHEGDLLSLLRSSTIMDSLSLSTVANIQWFSFMLIGKSQTLPLCSTCLSASLHMLLLLLNISELRLDDSIMQAYSSADPLERYGNPILGV